MGSASISLVSAPYCHVRPWSRLFVHLAAPAADRRDVRGLATLAQHDGDERCDRGVAVLRPASVRGHVLGQRSGLEPARGGAPRQLSLRLAGHPTLVYGQYRRAPHPSSLWPKPILPAARRAARTP